MNFIFISPNFPENYWNFCAALKRNGVTVFGVTGNYSGSGGGSGAKLFDSIANNKEDVVTGSEQDELVANKALRKYCKQDGYYIIKDNLT